MFDYFNLIFYITNKTACKYLKCQILASVSCLSIERASRLWYIHSMKYSVVKRKEPGQESRDKFWTHITKWETSVRKGTRVFIVFKWRSGRGSAVERPWSSVVVRNPGAYLKNSGDSRTVRLSCMELMQWSHHPLQLSKSIQLSHKE